MNQHSYHAENGHWSSFLKEYCCTTFASIAKKIRNKQSSVVVGMSGIGKSSIVGILATRPEMILPHLPDPNYLFCLVDLNKVSRGDPTYFYRAMIRALHNSARQAGLSIADELRRLEIETRQWNDEQSWIFALEDAHDLVIAQAGKQLVWLLDRFDKACPNFNDDSLDTLRSLRDNNLFYNKLFYIVFSRKPLQRLRNWKTNSEFLEIVAGGSCWLLPLEDADARWTVQRAARRLQIEIPPAAEREIVKQSGGLPTFLKAASEVWAKLEEKEKGSAQRMPIQELQEKFLEEKVIKDTCLEIIEDLEPIERKVLLAIATDRQQINLNQGALDYLKNLGVLKCEDGIYSIFSPLLKAYLHEFVKKMPGYISVDEDRKLVLRDGLPLEVKLTPTQYNLLVYMLKNSNRVLSFDDMIGHLWPTLPEEDRKNQKKAFYPHINGLQAELDKCVPGRIRCERGHGYCLEQPDLPDEYKRLYAG